MYKDKVDMQPGEEATQPSPPPPHEQTTWEAIDVLMDIVDNMELTLQEIRRNQ